MYQTSDPLARHWLIAIPLYTFDTDYTVILICGFHSVMYQNVSAWVETGGNKCFTHYHIDSIQEFVKRNLSHYQYFSFTACDFATSFKE